MSAKVKELLKSDSNCESYAQIKRVQFLPDSVYIFGGCDSISLNRYCCLLTLNYSLRDPSETRRATVVFGVK